MVDLTSAIGMVQIEAGIGYRGKHMVFSTQDGIKATVGATQLANANLNAMINRVTTVTSVGDSATLPVADVGKICIVISTSTNQMNIYPGVGEQINNLGANAAYSFTGSAAGKVALFVCPIKGQWHVLLSA